MTLPAETIVDSPRRKSPSAWQGLFTGLAVRMHIVRYSGFAVLAICINLLSQNVVLSAFGGFWFGIYLAIAFGNGTGLVFKYIADKYWVFGDVDTSIGGNSRKFALYAVFGIGTTLLFWGVELAFHYIFESTFMTNVGAVVGLSLGYVIKFNLDKRVTFATAPKLSNFKPS